MLTQLTTVKDRLSITVTGDDIAARFTNARRTAVTEILETLCTMGHAHRGKAKGTFLP